MFIVQEVVKNPAGEPSYGVREVARAETMDLLIDELCALSVAAEMAARKKAASATYGTPDLILAHAEPADPPADDGDDADPDATVLDPNAAPDSVTPDAVTPDGRTWEAK